MPLGKPHEHAYTLKVIDVIADNPQYRRDDYGDWAILINVCTTCPHTHPIKFGERKAIHTRFDELITQISQGNTKG